MTPDELETRIAHGEKFVTKKLLDKIQTGLLLDHQQFVIKMQADEIKFTRKMAFFAWVGWLLTTIITGFLI